MVLVHGRYARNRPILMDSVFAFADLPIRALIFLGILGLLFSIGFGLIVIFFEVTGWLHVSGYAATILTVLFLGALKTTCLGILGAYICRTCGVTQRRPLAVVVWTPSFPGRQLKSNKVDRS